jgi:hypothetical protein
MAAASMKTMLKVFHRTSTQREKNQGPDEIRRLTEQDLAQMTKLQRRAGQ